MSHMVQRGCAGPLPGAGILFNNLGFSEPTPLGSWAVPQVAGIYAILIPDPAWKPKPFRVLRFSEAANVAEDLQNPENQAAWRQAAGRQTLYFSVHLTPFALASERGKMCADLVRIYEPACQGASPSETTLDSRIRDLEAKYGQHEAQFKLVLAAIGRVLEPGPEPPKRRMGFV